MEESNIDPSLIEFIQILTKSDGSKEDLSDSIAYFRGKYLYIFANITKNIMWNVTNDIIVAEISRASKRVKQKKGL